jgi:hypothetical protein
MDLLYSFAQGAAESGGKRLFSKNDNNNSSSHSNGVSSNVIYVENKPKLDVIDVSKIPSSLLAKWSEEDLIDLESLIGNIIDGDIKQVRASILRKMKIVPQNFKTREELELQSLINKNNKLAEENRLAVMEEKKKIDESKRRSDAINELNHDCFKLHNLKISVINIRMRYKIILSIIKKQVIIYTCTPYKKYVSSFKQDMKSIKELGEYICSNKFEKQPVISYCCQITEFEETSCYAISEDFNHPISLSNKFDLYCDMDVNWLESCVKAIESFKS